MSDVIAKTEGALVSVAQAKRALEGGHFSRGSQLLSDVKRSGISIIKETEYLLERVSAVERHYRDLDNAKSKRIGELYDLEQTARQKKEEKRRATKSKESDLRDAKEDLHSAEDVRRKARRRKDEAEGSKFANIAGAVGFGAATVLTLGLASPITVPGFTICTTNAILASVEEKEAEETIDRCTSTIRQCERDISQYKRDISRLDGEISDQSKETARLKSERDRIHAQRGEITESIKYLRDTLTFWREFSQLTVHGTKRTTLLQRLSNILSIHHRPASQISRQLQNCVTAWDDVEKKLGKGGGHVFTINFTCHYCHRTFHDFPHLSYKKFCCTQCFS